MLFPPCEQLLEFPAEDRVAMLAKYTGSSSAFGLEARSCTSPPRPCRPPAGERKENMEKTSRGEWACCAPGGAFVGVFYTQGALDMWEDGAAAVVEREALVLQLKGAAHPHPPHPAPTHPPTRPYTHLTYPPRTQR